MTHLRSNSLFDNRFEIDRKVGSGGMGTVYRARDRLGGNWVALKLLQLRNGTQEATRFAREAQILGELRHPHIVSYVAHGIDEEGQPYLAMEWLEGEDLSQRLRRGPLSFSEAVSLLRGASAALAQTHQQDVVHRDLKPGNLFLCGGDPARVMLLDFGIARRMLRSGGLTQTGVVIGTPDYMAPEQARSERDLGPPADIFSLGCVLYECLAGAPPFTGEHVAAVLIKVLFEDPPPIAARRLGIPHALADLLARTLCKSPSERFPHGQALHEAVCQLNLPAEESVEVTAQTIAAPLALTPQEQQIFSLAVAVPASAESQASPLTPNESGERLARYQSVAQSLRELGAGVERLADGTIVATLFPSASVSDQVFLAARCGLLMKERLPDWEVAVATGRGLLNGRLPLGEAIDRGMQLLKGQPLALAAESSATGVWLDELTDSLLAGRFQTARRNGQTQLLREQAPTTGEDVRRLLGQPVPCVGRDGELAILGSVLATCIADSEAHAVGVVAPPGMGKSRLRHEFLRSAAQRHPELVVLLGRGEIMNPGASYGILAQAIRRLCGLVGGEPESVQQDRLRERLGRHLGQVSARHVISFLGELCGLHFPSGGDPALEAARNDPRVMHEQVRLAFFAWLRSECQVAPVLLVLEDLHWGDALTAGLLVPSPSDFDHLNQPNPAA